LALVTIALVPILVSAQEPAKEFVQALRDNGYYDLAIKYLEDTEKGNLIDKRFRNQIPLEKAETLIQSVNKIRDLEKWETRLAEAQALLTEYTSKAKDPESIATSQQYQANLSYRQARVYLKRSESDRLTASEKETQLTNARERMDKSLNGYLAAQKTLKDFLANFKINPKRVAESTQLRDDMRKMFVGVRLKAPIVREALADTFTDEAKKKKQLKTASEEFEVLWNKYYNFPQGLDACLYAARTNYKLKNYKKALTFTAEIFNLSNSSAFRTIKRKGAVVAVDCWKAMKPFPVNEIIEALEEPVSKLNRKDKTHPEWLQVQLELAKAYWARANEVKKANGKPSEIRRWKKMAGTLARSVSRSPSPVREESRELLTKWKVNFNENPGEAEKSIDTFIAAKDKARELASELETSLIEVSQVRGKWRAAKDPGKKSALESELDTARAELMTQSNATLGMLQRALVLSDENTSRDELNLIRYLQCFSYYSSERYFESGIIGEFMLERYPNVGWTQQASGLIVKSYSRLYDAAPKDQKDFESQRLEKVCSNIIKRWPGSNEAINSAEKLANIAMIDENYTKAEEYLSTIPADQPSRTSLSLRVGSKLWDQYREDNPRDPEKLGRAIALLKEGVDNSNIENLTFPAALGAMRLVRAHLANNDVAKSMESLEKAKIAPIDLLKQKHPVIVNSRFVKQYSKETYKTAINTYLAALKAGGYDEESLTNKCLGSLQGLKQILEGEGDSGKKQLVDTYKVVASRLNDVFDSITEPARKNKMATNIGKLLGALEKDATDGRTVLWAGETMLLIADQVRDSDAEISRSLYTQADSAFERSSQLGFKGDPEESLINLELGRLQALSKRGAGQFQAAVEALEKVLKSKPNYLQAQLDIAETLYLWGKSENLAKAYAESMGGRGSYTDDKGKRKKLVWGWQQMIKMTIREQDLRETYFRVQLGQTQTMLDYGLLAKNKKAFESVRRDLKNFRERNSDLGGDKWRPKFEALEQRFNSEVK
jgi:hypothetical protein